MIPAILGCTGTGKTALAVALAERAGGEIVSVDSAQVFRGMDIGTAKPTAEERARAAHQLIDVIDPNTQWTAAAFAAAADAAIDDIRSRGKRPILCGGAGLWYRALLHGVFEAPEIAPEIRARVREDLETLGTPAVHGQLARVDPVAAARLHPNDKQRIGRALELFLQTGTPISALQDAHGFATVRHEVAAIALDWDRRALTDRLAERTFAMFEAGLIEETEALISGGADPHGPGLSCIGYRESVSHLEGQLTREEAIECAMIATRQYAKRQRNWFRSEAVAWIPPDTPIEEIERRLQLTDP